jgi:hypothetical protein
MRLIPLALLLCGCSQLIAYGVSYTTDDDCERAAKHVQSCCPGFHPRDVHCSYAASSSTRPAWSGDQSACVQQSTCDQIRQAGARGAFLCGWAFRVSDEERYACEAPPPQ